MLQRYDQNMNNHPLSRIQNEFNQMIRRFFDEPFFQPQTQSFMPAVNVREEQKQYVLEAEIPGLQLEDVDIEINGNILTIKGEKRSEEKREKDRFHFVESRFGSFHRSFNLPENVDIEKITAENKNGVLYVYMPKTISNTTRKIEVKRNDVH